MNEKVDEPSEGGKSQLEVFNYCPKYWILTVNEFAPDHVGRYSPYSYDVAYVALFPDG